MGILKGLESLGLGKMKDLDIFAEEKEEAREKPEARKVEKVVDEASFLLDKTCKCPVCDKVFKSKAVKTGRARLAAQDDDLRPWYHDFDALKYEIIACPICGYSSLPRTFDKLTLPQAKLIKENISMSFTGFKEAKGEDTYGYDEAIERCRLALVNTVVKKGKLGERAYVCLNMAWLLRGKLRNLPEDTPDRESVAAQLKEDELEMLTNARDGFIAAFSKETFPLYSLDEKTSIYIVGALCAETGDNDNALRWLSRLITSQSANERIKERARMLKEKINNGEN
ncbi:MAG: DUF2225 domain-containing protein [Lachnospiraceae bacterium]|nr:DUF2225 domain-containing protein [Lachnospiraceae bacterium]